jgi:hypothetical protein
MTACIPSLIYFPASIILLSLFSLFVLSILCLYRLYFCPLRLIPGPKLAAITRLYEFYYNAIRSYKYGEQVEVLHRHYGP